MLEGLYSWLAWHGAPFALAAVLALVVIDACVFPALPDLFATLAFLLDPGLWWGLAILSTVCLGEITGNSLLYALVRRKQLPEFVQRAMRRWVDFLVLKDERVLLLNRFAPIVPYSGAFIATCGWSYRRSIAYIAVGGLAKYSILLCMASIIHATLDGSLAFAVTVVAVLAIICASLATSYYYRRRHGLGRGPGEGL
jgi:hypothetical protein